jgi:alginate O-acetyltransferase complex protein AlgI
MLFFSWVFAAFFAVFYPAYLLVRRHVVARNLLLILAAYIFYGWWDVRFLALLAFTTGLDYLTALGAAGHKVRRVQLLKSCVFLAGITLTGFFIQSFLAPTAAHDFRVVSLLLGPSLAGILLFTGSVAAINRVKDETRRRYRWLLLSVIVNLSVLAFFKYVNFFGESLEDALRPLGIQLGFVALNIILPLGISFHTFQSIGRTVDTWRGKLEPSTSLIEFAAFLSYFPQILAGPIERANHMLPQFRTVLPISAPMLRSGAMLFLWGLFKKIVIADNMALIANPVFDEPNLHSSGTILVAALAFTIQIYGDFSGYTDMARGLARLMGFELRQNFNLPYFSRTPSEFWQRWHISLSQWLRDYLYISLGGNRSSEAKTYRNLMVTMLLGGLWHGAAWTFVFWGFLHGGAQIIYRVLGIDRRIAAINAKGGGAVVVTNLAGWATWMPVVVLTWIYFRAATMAQGNAMVAGILRLNHLGDGQWARWAFYAVPLLLIECGLRFALPREAFDRAPFIAKYTGVIALLYSVLVLTAPAGQEFIYFDF